MDGIWRWSLERDEPDASDRWKPAHRRKVLNFLHIRDGERCGLCGGTMKLKGAQVEHVVPKRFAVFELSAEGEARQGTYYTSVLHGMENLQAAHPRCNKYKGNTPRHSPMEAPEHARAGRSQNQRRSGADAATAGRRVDETERRGIDLAASRTLTTSPTVSGMLRPIGAGAR